MCCRPFKVVSDGGKSNIQVEFKGEITTYAPEEICSMTLVQLKETAEAYLETKLTDAIITVPACFDDSQCQVTAKYIFLNTFYWF